MAVPPALASLEDLEARLPAPISDADGPRARAALDDASALVRTEADPEDWVDDLGALEAVPPIIIAVVCAAARRALANPGGVQSESIAGYSYSLANASGDVYLTAAEKRLIRKALGRGGLGSIVLESPFTPSDPRTDSTGYPYYLDWYDSV